MQNAICNSEHIVKQRSHQGGCPEAIVLIIHNEKNLASHSRRISIFLHQHTATFFSLLPQLKASVRFYFLDFYPILSQARLILKFQVFTDNFSWNFAMNTGIGRNELSNKQNCFAFPISWNVYKIYRLVFILSYFKQLIKCIF